MPKTTQLSGKSWCGQCEDWATPGPLIEIVESDSATVGAVSEKRGHVYVLVNSLMPGQVKIGKTSKDPEVRATELSGTGVAVPYVVAYSELVEDCQEVERLVHDILAPYRINEKREFFRVSARQAIEAVKQAIRRT